MTEEAPPAEAAAATAAAAPQEPEWDAAAAVEAVRQKVQAYLLRETEIGLDQRGRITIDRGSTRIFVEFFPQPDKKLVYITLTCPVAFYVPMTPELYEHIARTVDKWYFGHLAMSPYPDDGEHAGTAYISFTHALIGEYLDPPELIIPVFALLNTADAIDDEFVEKFGGVRYQDS